MNDLMTCNPPVEEIPADRQLVCLVKANPFAMGAKRVMVVAGDTLEDMVCQFVADRWPDTYIHCQIDGERVPRAMWRRVKPKPGHEVTICVTPLGTGEEGGTAQLVIGALLVVAGILFTVFGMPGIGMFLIKAGGMMMLSGGLQLAFPPTVPSMGQLSGSGGKKDSPTLFIRGARNQSRPFEVVPRVYGYNKVVPAYGAMPYTQERGDEQYLRLLFCLGYGPLDITEMKIGDTPIEYYGIEDDDIEIRYGFPGDQKITIFPNTVITTDLAILLTDDWQQRTTLPDTDEISVDFEFPRGLFGVDDKGKNYRLSVEIRLEYRAVGSSGDWTVPPGFPKKIADTKTSPFLEGSEFKVSRGHYDVRVKRTKAESTDLRKNDKAAWTSLRSIRNVDPIKISKIFPRNYLNYTRGLAKVAMKIKATDQLNNVVDTFNCRVRSIVPDFGNWDLMWNGSKTHLSAPAFSGLTGAAARTVECMVFAYGVGGIFQQGEESVDNQDFALAVVNAGTETWRVCLGNTVYEDVVLAGSIEAWHHYALVYDGTDVILYYDGVEAGSWAHTLATASHDFLIGRANNAMANARIKQMRVWNSAKTEAEVASYNGNVFTRYRSGLLAYWRLSEGSGEKVFDYGSSNSHLSFPSSSPPVWHEGPAELRIWEPRPTSNPASHLLDVFQGLANKRAVADSRVDFDEMEAFHSYCKTKGWTFNFVFDYNSTIYETAQIIASAGRATLSMRDGKYSLVRDYPQTTPVQKFNPRNSRGFRGYKTFHDDPHAVRVRYVSEVLDFEQTELIVYNDGYSEENATIFEAIDLKGKTNKEEVRAQARYILATAKLRPEQFELTTDFEYLVCTRGDLVTVAHDVISVGLGYGRIKSVTRNEADKIVSITLDNSILMEAGKTYGLSIREAASFTTYPLSTVAGESASVTLQTPTTGTASAGDLYSYGETGLEEMDCILIDVQPQEDLSARLALVPAAPGVHTAEDANIPTYDPMITHQGDLRRIVSQPVILSAISDATTAEVLPGGQRRARIQIKYRVTDGQNIPADFVQAQYRQVGTARYQNMPYVRINDERVVYVTGVTSGRLYDVRLRAIGGIGLASSWAELGGIFAKESDVPPPDVTNFWITETQSGIKRMNWRFEGFAPDTIAGVRIRARRGSGWGWDEMAPLHSGIVTISPFETTAPAQKALFSIGIKAVSTSGVESTNATIIEYTISYTPPGIALQEDCRFLGWPGTITNGFSNNIENSRRVGDLQSSSPKTWADLATDGVTWATWTNWTRNESTLTYEHEVMDAGALIRTIPSGSVLYDGTIQTWERHSADNTTWSTYAGLNEMVPIMARYFQFKVAVTGTPGLLKELVIQI